MSKMQLIFIVSAFGIFSVIYSNCADVQSVKFSSQTDHEFLRQCAQDSSINKDCPNVAFESFQKSFSAAPTDILLVLDDSCSMQTIASELAQGFASLPSGNFADDTQMALTYMHPAKLNSSGGILFSTPYRNKAYADSPGFMKLVNQNRMQNFLANNPQFQSDVPKNLCQQQWFAPDATNAQGDACVEVAAQLARICTGTEAGLVSLEQLLAKESQAGRRLFREGAIVNVVFISDTHEAGSNYFGQPNAPALMKTYEEMVSIINDNSPGVASLKMSGVVPLPVVGSPLYNGLNTAGPIPQNASEAYINAEGTHDHSYLPFIKATGGIAAHAKTSDWSEIA